MTDTLKPTLLSCPFCGQAPSVAEEDGVTLYCEAGSRDWYVSCDMCGAHSRFGTKPDAITAWNTRPDGEREALIEALGDILDHFADRTQAPGHCHTLPGIWDDDNGEKAGKPCDWCAKWERARSTLHALSRNNGNG